jgi:3-methyladenine DNA glycosylase AlkD
MIREGAWWDLVDGIASNLVGIAYMDHRKAIRRILDRWIEDPDLWIRRSALLAQLQHKSETDSAQLFRYCLLCAGERDLFIRKAIGWALREYSYSEPAKVKAFLLKHGEKLSPLSFREASKRLL